jgi:hypothetical protein
MIEQGPPTGLDEPEAEGSWAAAYPAGRTTGVAAVDRVLADVDGLDELPLAEHLGAFERAHEGLRAALDALPDPEPDRAPDPVADDSEVTPTEPPDDSA